jgi:hypothetical protein
MDERQIVTAMIGTERSRRIEIVQWATRLGP